MILVDPLFAVAPAMVTGRWPYRQACHMMSDQVGPDGLAELLAFATTLGLQAAWLQTPTRGPHFDLTPGKRALAVRLGAIEVTREEFSERCTRPWLRYAAAVREHRPDPLTIAYHAGWPETEPHP